MTDLIALAKQAGFDTSKGHPIVRHSNGSWVGVSEELQAFADLIAQREREACAVACEEVGMWPSLGPRHCAESIRARTTT